MVLCLLKYSYIVLCMACSLKIENFKPVSQTIIHGTRISIAALQKSDCNSIYLCICTCMYVSIAFVVLLFCMTNWKSLPHHHHHHCTNSIRFTCSRLHFPLLLFHHYSRKKSEKGMSRALLHWESHRNRGKEKWFCSPHMSILFPIYFFLHK